MMAHPKLLAILETNIDQYWSEMKAGEFDQLLAELETGKRITTEERQSLLLRLGLKKLREEPGEGDDASPLRP